VKHGEATLRELLAPIQDLLDDPIATEIVINKPCEIGTEHAGKWTWREVAAFDYARLDAIGIVAGYMTGRRSDPAYPLCGTTLPDGQRIQICRPAATLDGIIAMCIRKPPKQARRLEGPDLDALFSIANTGPTRQSAANTYLLDLYHQRMWREFLFAAVKARKTIGTTGLTGSGKSDLLRRLCGAVPEEHRLVTAESDPEFGKVGPRNTLNLFFNEDRQGQRAIDVVNASLRMFPSTIAFQEVRGAEAFPLMRAIASGHNSFTSWHAAEGHEIAAMCTMLRQHPACQTLPQEQLTAMVTQCFDIVMSFEKDGGDFRVRRVWFKAAEQAKELAA
jgi:type IV secretion system protein VirB11